jgi:hypothetical protein
MLPWFLLCLVWCWGLAASAASYDVGPGQGIPKLGEVPWKTLRPGDVVRIHWRPEPFQERVLLSTSGTLEAPIRVEGVLGPAGQMPVVEGRDAVVATGVNGLHGGRSVVQVGFGDLEPGQVPAHLEILNLEIRGGRPPNRFLGADGAWHEYSAFAAALYVARGQHLLIRNCRFLDSGNGLVVGSSDRTASKDLRIEACEFRGNGNPGSITEHNCYTAAQGITFQGNLFGPPHPGARGNNLKDRSSGLVVACNWIEGGNRQLDLVDAEDSILIRQDPAYRVSYVLNNVLLEPENDGNRQIIHYGGDTGATTDYRKGTLYFWQNTVVSFRTDGTALFNLSTDDEHLDLRNNVFHAAVAGAPLALLEESGTVEMQSNWMTRGWRPRFSIFGGGSIRTQGTVEGVAPGFLPKTPPLFCLATDSSCVGLAEPLPKPFSELIGAASFHATIRPRVGWRRGDLGAVDGNVK